MSKMYSTFCLRIFASENELKSSKLLFFHVKCFCSSAVSGQNMLYSTSARRRSIQKRASSRHSSRGSPWGSDVQTSDEIRPSNLAVENDSSPSHKISGSNNSLRNTFDRVSFRASLFKKRHGPKKKRPSPIDFVIEENSKVDAIKELIDSSDYNAALQSLLSDTGEDFHYYNQLKNETQRDHHEQSFSRRHGNLKCSIDQQQPSTNDRECLWHGETDRGFPLRCQNKCLNHPYEKVKNHLGVPLRKF